MRWASAAWAGCRGIGHQGGRLRFGRGLVRDRPEYERAVEAKHGRRAGERELREREERHDALDCTMPTGQQRAIRPGLAAPS
ncbi:hypothetical protein ACFU9X_29575 [Streptomyces atratus]|uniref:hypothetical protein n=1 Tax=Streptomyces atratus TaxID=1893 RepID=UPI003673860F